MITTTDQLTREDAQRLIARARDAAVALDEILMALWAGRGHVALGYPATAAGWQACCAENLPELRTFTLRREPRTELAQAMHRAGASVGVIAGALSVSKSTAHAAVSTMPDRPATVTSADGSRRVGVDRKPAASPTAPARPLRARLVELLAARGPLTARELEAATRAHPNTLSPALSSLTAAGRLDYTPGARRGVSGLYSAPAGGAR